VAEERIRRSPGTKQTASGAEIQNGEIRKGVFFVTEAELPPGFVPPSVSLTPAVPDPAPVQPTVAQDSPQEG
jgi:hypothetical protein